MPIKILVVDDSRFFRNRLCDILGKEGDFEVVATAENGREAVEKAALLKPDVITMDIEMPVMDGIAAVREIMKQRPVPVMMFSSITTEGAQATLDALDAGAVDFMPKRLEDMAGTHQDFVRELCAKIRAVARRSTPLAKLAHPTYNPVFRPRAEQAGKPTATGAAGASFRLAGCRIVAIGASTGGPSALQEIISKLPKNYPVPVLIIQHMPAAFTGPFAKRLGSLGQIAVKEAEDGDVLLPGRVLVAPGRKQTVVADHGGKKVLRIEEATPEQHYKPSIDISFLSVAANYGKHSLAIVLTGMGADGREGAAMLKRYGSAVWAQDEASSVVYGMPQAVSEAGLADRVLSITDIARLLAAGA